MRFLKGSHQAETLRTDKTVMQVDAIPPSATRGRYNNMKCNTYKKQVYVLFAGLF